MDILIEQAATYDECLKKIHDKHGPHIHVLRQKQVKLGGFLGFFERDGIELSFIISREAQRSVPVQQRPLSFEDEKARIIRQAARTSPELAARVAPQLEALRQQEGERSKNEQVRTSTVVRENVADMDSILKAVKKLEQKLDRVPDPSSSDSSDHETIVKVQELLERNDFSPSFIRTLCSRICSEFSLQELGDFQAIQDTVVEWIGEKIAIHYPRTTDRPQKMVLVGPTGVGKTTTVAKLAAVHALGAIKGTRPLNVRIITIDNYRIGAKQQIETYGNIMNIPVSYAETADDLRSLIAMYQDVDIILIDTIGKSPKDYAKIAEMRHILDAAGPVSDVFLAMSATTKSSDMREIMQQYETFGYSSVIVTKFDETTRVGNIISMLEERKKPLAYITTGQRVPQDFEEPSVVKLLIHLDGFRINRSRIEDVFPVSGTRFEWR